MIPVTLHHFNENACSVTIGQHRFYFSYDTCIAYANSELAIKSATKYSATTTKHLGLMGLNRFDSLTQDLFDHGIKEACKLTGWKL